MTREFGFGGKRPDLVEKRARSTQKYVARNRINCLSWPAQSPDLNIIENVWLFIKQKLQSCIGTIKSKENLIEEIL